MALTPSQILVSAVDQIKKSLNNLQSDILDQVVIKDLDCTNLPKLGESWMENKPLKDFMDFLHYDERNQNPAIYWFEVASHHSASEIYDSVVKLKTTLNRNLPAHKKTLPLPDAKILYVGKVQNNLAGRMLLHLGYINQGATQGLQLSNWTALKGLKLKLNVIYLPTDLVDLTGLFEVKIAKELQPILGKHR